jgi:chemotaxis protein MotB
VLVTASTCNIPYRSSSNWHLSGERGAEVAYTLSTKGKIPPGRILVMALGQYHPLVPNNSEARRALNRRVDIRIIDGTAARDLLPAARR